MVITVHHSKDPDKVVNLIPNDTLTITDKDGIKIVTLTLLENYDLDIIMEKEIFDAAHRNGAPPGET